MIEGIIAAIAFGYCAAVLSYFLVALRQSEKFEDPLIVASLLAGAFILTVYFFIRMVHWSWETSIPFTS